MRLEENVSKRATTSAVSVLLIELENDANWRGPVPVTEILVRMEEHVGSPTLVTSSACADQDSKEPTVR